MTESNYEWQKKCTCFKSDSTKITLMHRSDQKKWNLHWQISENWQGSIEALRNTVECVVKWVGWIEIILNALTALFFLAGLGTIPYSVLVSVVLILAAGGFFSLKRFVLDRGHYIFNCAEAKISIGVSFQAIPDVNRGDKDGKEKNS